MAISAEALKFMAVTDGSWTDSYDVPLLNVFYVVFRTRLRLPSFYCGTLTPLTLSDKGRSETASLTLEMRTLMAEFATAASALPPYAPIEFFF